MNSKEYETYSIVHESKNIIMTLVNGINANETYKKHVKKLSDSENIKNQKIAYKINTTIEKIKVFNTKDTPLFLASDIGILLGISRVNYAIRKFDPEEKVEGYITKNNKLKKVIFLTRHGVYRASIVSSKSELARLLKKFIYNLIDHMLLKEPKSVEAISIKFQLENHELIERGMLDLSNKLLEIENKYIEEQKKTKLLEEQYNEEQKKRLEIQEENTEIEIINSYNDMHIEQLKKEKIIYLDKIKNINETIAFNDFNSIDQIELRLLKEKFMKPLYLYILHPNYFNKLLNNKKKQFGCNSSSIQTQSDSDDELNIKESQNHTNHQIYNKKHCNELMVIDSLLEDKTYKNNFINIFAKNEIFIEPDEILYFCFGFGRNIAKKDKVMLVNMQWIVNKKHYANVLNTLHNTGDTLYLSKISLFKTSLDEINDIIKDEFINL